MMSSYRKSHHFGGKSTAAQISVSISGGFDEFCDVSWFVSLAIVFDTVRMSKDG